MPGAGIQKAERGQSQVAYQRDFYAILQVPRNASQDDIERAYQRLKAAYDPQTSRKKRATSRYADVQAAYETLSSPAKRKAYDRQLVQTSRVGGSALPSDVLSSRFVWISGGIIVASIAIIVALILFVGKGDDGGEAVADTATATPASPTATPFGQTPRPTPPGAPPAVEGEPVTTASGLQIYTIQDGGEQITAGDTAYVEYSGWLQADNTLFDSSYNPGGAAFAVTPVGTASVIDGWNEGLQLMKEGGKYRLVIPPELAYGVDGRGGIPGNATLIFDMEPISVLKPGETATPVPTPIPADTPTPAAATDAATESPSS